MTSVYAPKEFYYNVPDPSDWCQDTLRIRSLMLGHYRVLDWDRQLCDNAK